MRSKDKICDLKAEQREVHVANYLWLAVDGSALVKRDERERVEEHRLWTVLVM
jgi:hypothetical protein